MPEIGARPVRAINDLMDLLGTTTPMLVPMWESVGSVVTAIAPTGLTSSDEAAARALEAEFAPLRHPDPFGSFHSYLFQQSGNQHLAGLDDAAYSFGNGTVDTPFSCGMWILPTDITSVTMLSKFNGAGAAEEWRFFIDASSFLSLELHDASASATEIGVTTATVELGKWQFVAASYDGGETTPVVRLYIWSPTESAFAANGTGATAETGAYVAMENTATPILVGCDGVTATPANEFQGRIFMPWLTGSELTAPQMRNIYSLTGKLLGV